MLRLRVGYPFTLLNTSNKYILKVVLNTVVLLSKFLIILYTHIHMECDTEMVEYIHPGFKIRKDISACMDFAYPRCINDSSHHDLHSKNFRNLDVLREENINMYSTLLCHFHCIHSIACEVNILYV